MAKAGDLVERVRQRWCIRCAAGGKHGRRAHRRRVGRRDGGHAAHRRPIGRPESLALAWQPLGGIGPGIKAAQIAGWDTVAMCNGIAAAQHQLETDAWPATPLNCRNPVPPRRAAVHKLCHAQFQASAADAIARRQRDPGADRCTVASRHGAQPVLDENAAAGSRGGSAGSGQRCDEKGVKHGVASMVGRQATLSIRVAWLTDFNPGVAKEMMVWSMRAAPKPLPRRQRRQPHVQVFLHGIARDEHLAWAAE